VIEAHELAVSIIYWLIGIHILAAIYHRLKKDGVWSSMVPLWKEK
jgi:cytochrome b561